MKLLFLLFCSFFSSAAVAEFRHFNEWTDHEKAEYAVYTTLAYIDYSQTSWAMRQKTPEGVTMFIEKNPIYGKNPSNDQIVFGQLVGMVAYYYYIGTKNENFNYVFSRGLLMGIKLAAVVHNDCVGVSISKAW